MIAGVISLHPDYIDEILKMDSDVDFDINLIVKLDKYTNERNYNKSLTYLII